MPTCKRFVAAALAVAGTLGSASASFANSADLQRAKTKKPRDDYKGKDQTELSKVLNKHMKRSERVRPCDDWSPAELQEFMASILKERNHDLQEIYAKVKDRRQLKMGGVEEYRAHWDELDGAVKKYPHLLQPHKESHCRQAVMWWTHHLTDEKRSHLRKQNITVPLLPEGPKLACGQGQGADEHKACVGINEPNSCDWCHSTQAKHDAGVPGTSAPDALKKRPYGPDDGNPHKWDRKRRCDQDQFPRCQMCEGIGGKAWSDKNEDIELTPCTPVAAPKDVNMSTVAPPVYPKQFTVKRKDGKQGGYSDTLIGWKKDPFCFAFFPQNDSIPALCYRSQDAYVKYYDIEREAARTDYNVKLTGAFSHAPNITAEILMVQDTMWIQNHLWAVDQCICSNPSGNHCTNPPCKSYVWNWDTFKNAQYLGRERIGAEWIQHHGTGKNSKMMELDHFILWAHHIWTDPASRRLVRAWKPFNGLQLYDPDAWTDSVEEPDKVFEAPPKACKKGGAKIRIHCDDEGHYHEGKSEGLEHLEALYQKFKSMSQATEIVI
eukprot:TRINITY_DN280_c0_g1_i1.p1 TRINITY_DN280_c0_g1~~TRINITY_DN280_c0_g1_i1.p1  ORF type:complete len:549 (+),score=119.48 TRINITY_DN280_c0_g1_i1:79-1725(+)